MKRGGPGGEITRVPDFSLVFPNRRKYVPLLILAQASFGQPFRKCLLQGRREETLEAYYR